MAEDPVKLFSNRAERYPGPTDTDLVQGATRAALAAIPVIGGTITEVLSMVLARPWRGDAISGSKIWPTGLMSWRLK